MTTGRSGIPAFKETISREKDGLKTHTVWLDKAEIGAEAEPLKSYWKADRARHHVYLGGQARQYKLNQPKQAATLTRTPGQHIYLAGRWSDEAVHLPSWSCYAVYICNLSRPTVTGQQHWARKTGHHIHLECQNAGEKLNPGIIPHLSVIDITASWSVRYRRSRISPLVPH